MKYLTIAVAVGFGFAALADDKVEVSQLPRAVVKALDEAKGTNVIKDIERRVEKGKTVYEVELDRRGLNPKIWIAEDGTIVKNRIKDVNPGQTFQGGEAVYAPPIVRIPTLRTSDLPGAVQRTVQQQSAGREVADIDKENWDGRTVYEVEFAQTGRNAQIHVAEDGTVVKEERKGSDRGLFGLFMGTQLEDTPASVQETIKREARDGQIVDIDKEIRSGETLYEVEVKRGNGRDGNYEFHVAENGTIVRDSRNQNAIGTPARRTETGAASGTDRDVRNLTLSDLPAAVQDQVKAQGDVSTLKRIQRQTRDGKVVYEVELQQAGRDKTLRIAEDGTVVNE